MSRRVKRGQNTWVPEHQYNPEWVHRRAVGCGGVPTTSNPDRVTCPTCLAPEHRTETRQFDD